MQYYNLSYVFKIEEYSFQVSMAAVEKFERSIPSHSHGKGCYEIHYIVSGNGTAVIDGKTYSLDANSLYITGPSVVHEQVPFAPDPMIEYCIYVQLLHDTGKHITGNTLVTAFKETAFWLGQDTQNIRQVLQMILYELEHKNKGHHTMLTALFQQLIVCLVRNYTNTSHSNNPAEYSASGQPSLLAIEEAFLYDYKDITLEQLASRMNVSPRQAERLLSQYYNSTFIKKRTEARMSAASILLKTHTYSIGKVGELVGYSSSEHFSHAFKKYFGISAGGYRKQLLP